jgi:metal-responsive CopG/Arc/MetJ family transcriptional regulator
MKTTISVPDDVFEEADRLAESSGLSRSELYVAALRAYLVASRGERVTTQLNAICDADVADDNAFPARAARAIGHATQA